MTELPRIISVDDHVIERVQLGSDMVGRHGVVVDDLKTDDHCELAPTAAPPATATVQAASGGWRGVPSGRWMIHQPLGRRLGR